MDIAYLWKKKQKMFANICGYNNEKTISPRTVLRIYEKFFFYELCNKYNKNTFAIINFFNISSPYYVLLLQQSSIHVFPMVQSTFECTEDNLWSDQK